MDPYPLLGTRVAVAPVDGSGARFITPLDLVGGAPVWHPCDEVIAFNTYPLNLYPETSEPGNVYTMDPDGGNLRQVTTESVDGSLRFGAPRWSNDGQELTVTILRAPGSGLPGLEVATVPASGGKAVPIGIVDASVGTPQPGHGEDCTAAP